MKKTKSEQRRAVAGIPVAAFQGELGAFSHAAAEKLLGLNIAPLACQTFGSLFAAVESGEARYGVVPIENTLHGSILENYDNLVERKIPIVGEVSVRISHQLITVPGTLLKNVRRVFSHPVALNQCRRFFAAHPKLEPVPYYDTAGSVKMLMENRPAESAAIASARAAEIYTGTILRRNIEDNQENFTRFFLLSKQDRVRAHVQLAPDQGRAWKTSLVCSMANQPSALFKALACFALRDIDLTKIESRPLRGKPWEYLFYIDILGGLSDEAVKNALANLQERAQFVRILGSYQPTP